jgi:hypothetical protein
MADQTMSGRHVLFLAVVVTLGSCAVSREQDSTDLVPNEQRRISMTRTSTIFNCGDDRVSREECQASGGFVDRRGMSGARMCVVPFDDAGKECKNSRECQGRCLVLLGRKLNEPKPGDTVTGECELDNKTFGCLLEVVDGVAGGITCVD